MTKATPTVGRIIYVRSNLWEGVRAAVIAAVILSADSTVESVRANVMLDGTTDAQVLDAFRERATGNTVELVGGDVFNPDSAPSFEGSGDWFLGTWMPFQVGQVPASLAVQGQLSAATEDIAALKATVISIADAMTKGAPGHPRHGLGTSARQALGC